MKYKFKQTKNKVSCKINLKVYLNNYILRCDSLFGLARFVVHCLRFGRRFGV